MKKVRRAAALIGVILLLALYGMTMVFALRHDAAAKNLFLGSVAATIFVPVVIYYMMRIAGEGKKSMKKGIADPEEETEDKPEEKAEEKPEDGPEEKTEDE